ncbi:Glycine betaine/L-proline transport ATP-binding protein ProV [Vibrio ruber DSM 16370]|uniref:Glycine betaine/L-proline transport ATP-binding protein ProV n=1 Tax=Vibrio ruber (strain DSM 16370 / JCM 11486 / BCRC 17186 / CECT 7878 / LMG 23124 / VR1) TaxID=1123498 RepID=A0A1R4LQX9_VIBR1|nr:choline ABC transporter ATP-binding protein [Vibrio ruber]SJN58925.1 Glycine betaine/L-proline transport ATP-binding protein ProV [Vibrio ruber DSM 16370]
MNQYVKHEAADAIAIENLDVVFGRQPEKATALLDQGKTRQEIIDETGLVVGVNNVSLTVKEGEICVLMGLSGSGKSSLLRAVNGLNQVTRGSLKVKHGQDFVDVASCNNETLRNLRTQRVSMVFQKFALMPWLSVVDNVAFGLEMQGISKKERRKHAREQLEMVGLADWENKYPHELSGGMQQRVGLARAFAMDSDILLMDEPFSALDPLIRTQLQDELLTLQKKLNKTILFVSHDLDEALKIGNRIAIMESGQLIQHSRPEEIVLQPETDYVREFVAHTNPLNVLKGRSLMKPIDELTHQEGRWQVCQQSDLWLENQNGKLVAQGPKSIKTIEWEKSLDIASLDKHTIILASPDIEMRDAIEIRYHTGYPIILVEDDQLVGILNDDNFYHALLGKYNETTKAA